MSASKSKKKIIIVEDKSIVSHDIKRRLEVLGYEVPGIAPSGEKAVELVKEHSPDLILMDIQLQGEMDGIEAANLIRKELDIPIIYLTAFSDEATLKRAMITDPYAYIIKPFEPRELQISIEIALYKHEMEAALAESKDFVDMILKNTEEGIFVLNEDFEYVYINEASGRMMGHDPKEWIGKRAGSNVHPDDAGIGLNALQVMYEKGKADFVARIQRMDGVYRNLYITYILITWQGEDHVLGVVNDITDRLESANRLRESEEKYRSLVDEAGDGIVVIDGDTKISYINDYLLKLGGYDREDVQDMEFMDFIPDDYLVDTMRMFEKALNGEESPAMEMDLKRKDGTFVSVGYKGTVTFKDGEFQGIRAIIRDASLRKKMEEALKDSEELYRTMFESSADAVMMLDADGFFDCNEATLYMFGLEHKNEFIGTHPSKFSPPDQPDGSDSETVANDRINEAYDWGHNRFEWVHRRSSGDDFPAEVWLTAFELKGRPVIQATVRDLTERKKMENELEKHREHLEVMVEETYKDLSESEEKYRSLVERANDGIAILQEGKVVFANQKITDMLGFEIADVIDKEFIIFVPDESKEIILGNYQKRMKGEKVPSIYEIDLQRKDGSIIPVEINAGVVTYNDRPADLAFIRDMTERKKAEQALISSEEKYRKLTETANDAIFLADVETGKIIEANKKAELLIGRSRDEIIGMHQSDLHPPEEVEEYIQIFKEHIEEGSAVSEPIDVVHKDGHRIPVLISASTFELDGKMVNQGIFHDITDIRKAETERRESEERFRILAETSSAATFIHKGGNFLFFNKATEEMSGYSREELMGMNFIEVVHPDSVDLVKERAMARLRGEDVTPNYEIKTVRKDGRIAWLEITGNQIHFQGEDAIIGTAFDITERKKAEEAPLLTQFMLERLSDAVFWMDSDARFFYVNNAACENLGYTRAELLGMTVHDIDPDFNKDIWPEHWEDLKNGSSSIIESTHKRKDDSVFPVEIANNYIRYMDKEYNCAIARDITERRKSEKAIQESHEKIKSMVSSMDDLIFGLDKEGVFIFYHYSGNGDLYVQPEEFLGKNYSEVMPPSICEMIDEGKMKNSKGEIHEFEYPLPSETGEHWFAAKMSPYMLNDEYIGSVSVIRNITEAKMSERALRDGEKFLANIFESIQDGLIVMDIDLNIVSTNQTIEEWFPHKMPFEGKTCNDVLLCDAQDSDCKCPSPDVLSSKKSDRRVIRKFGQENAHIGWLELHSFPLYDVDTGELNGVIEYIRDITEQRKAEEEKEEFQYQLDAFFHASTDGIGIEKNERFIYANPKLVELFGCDDVSELIGKKPGDFMTSESAKIVGKYHQQRSSGKHAPTYYDFKVVKKNDGTTFDAEVSIHEYEMRDEFYTVGFVKDVTELKKSRELEVQSRILEAQFEMKSVITDLVPIFLDSMGSEGRANFVSNLSEKLDKVLKEKYYDETKRNAKEVSEIYCQVLMDLGGEAQLDCPIDPMNCSNVVIKCPWSNEKTKNLILCILCRGIAWRFAQYSDQPMTVQLEHTMADGHSDCKITVSEKK